MKNYKLKFSNAITAKPGTDGCTDNCNVKLIQDNGKPPEPLFYPPREIAQLGSLSQADIAYFAPCPCIRSNEMIGLTSLILVTSYQHLLA